jgi:hypothetical protein
VVLALVTELFCVAIAVVQFIRERSCQIALGGANEKTKYWYVLAANDGTALLDYGTVVWSIAAMPH